MAEPTDNTSADKAPVTDVAEAKPAVPAEVAQLEPVAVAAPVAKAPAKATPTKAEAKAPAKAAPAKAPAPKPVVAKPAKRSVSRRKPAVVAKAKAPVVRKPVKVTAKRSPKPAAALSVTQLKEKIMATKNTAFSGDFTQIMSKTVTDAVAEMQSKAQAAYDKGTTLVAEMTDMAKGNAEAVVESGKILAAGAQDLGKTYADEAKAAYETLTADIKEMAAVKSPTELFQLQGKIMRRNFDAMVAATSKGTDAGMKLANEAIAPISARVNLAVEKFSKAA